MTETLQGSKKTKDRMAAQSAVAYSCHIRYSYILVDRDVAVLDKHRYDTWQMLIPLERAEKGS